MSSVLFPTIALGTYYTPLEISLPRSTRVDSDATQTTTTQPTDAEQAAEELTQLTDNASTPSVLKRSRISGASHGPGMKTKKRRELSTVPPPGDTRPPLRRRSRQQLRPPAAEEDRSPVGSRRKRRGAPPRAAPSAIGKGREKEGRKEGRKKEEQQKLS